MNDKDELRYKNALYTIELLEKQLNEANRVLKNIIDLNMRFKDV